MNTVQTFDAGTLFPGIPAGIAIRGWSESSPYTPQKNPHYMFPSWLEDIVAWLAYGQDSLYLFGPTGCGKTSCVKQVMHALNYPVYELTGHSRLEFPDMVGHHTVHEGSMHYEYGPLPLAMKEGGLFLLNEIDLLDPSTAAGLNSILDGYPLTIAENGGEHKIAGLHAHLLQQLRNQALILVSNRKEQVLRLQGLVLVFNGGLLGALQRFQRFLCKFVGVHWASPLFITEQSKNSYLF